MVLFRRLLGDVLRAQRMRRGMTLREVSAEARVSLGYISEIERGQKEASSELLASLCSALDLPLSAVLREVSDARRTGGGRWSRRRPAPRWSPRGLVARSGAWCGAPAGSRAPVRQRAPGRVVPARLTRSRVPHRRHGLPDRSEDPRPRPRQCCRWSPGWPAPCSPQQQPVGHRARPARRSATSATGVNGWTPVVKQSSAFVHVADAGEAALVEQGLADRRGRARPAGWRTASLLVPVGAEQVGAEVADERAPRRRGGAARRSPSEKPTATASSVSSTTRAWCARVVASAGRVRSTCQAPSIFRWVCSVQRSVVPVDAGQQVLAAGDGLEDGAAGQVGGGELGDPEVGGGEHLAG